MSETDTPRTDRIWNWPANQTPEGMLAYARQLERELTQAKAECEELKRDKLRLDWLDCEEEASWCIKACDMVGDSDPGTLRQAIDKAMEESE